MANKNNGKVVMAWELGTGSKKERQLIAEGKIVQTDNGYTLFSKKSTRKNAVAGDFFKVDNAGYPYPIEKKCFLENHWPLTELEPDSWEQLT